MRRLLSLLALLSCAPVASQAPPAIHLNQIGFYPEMEKVAAVVGAEGGDFQVVPAAGGAAVFVGQLGPELESEVWGAPTRLADFSAFRTPGSYRLTVAGMEASVPFDIGEAVHAGVALAALKAFYHHRVSVPTLPAHAGGMGPPGGPSR